MRLPLAIELDSRDGSANKDARMTNVLVERDDGVLMSCIRPGLTTLATRSGAGNGLIAFNASLVSIYANTAYVTGGSFDILTGTFTPA